MSKQEWQGVEDTPAARWVEMKARHARELSELQIENNKAVIVLITNHMAERDTLKRGNQ
jgi:Trk K+ transport system NAD-binding subunit